MFKYSPTRLVQLGLLVIAYAALEATEMVGLWFAKRWAEYVTFIATTLLVPIEVYELYLSVSAFKVLTLVINLAIVTYLLLAKRLVRAPRRPPGRAGAETRVRRVGGHRADTPPPTSPRTSGGGPCACPDSGPLGVPAGRMVTSTAYGPLAQLVAHLHDTQGVVGSSPARPTRKNALKDPRRNPEKGKSEGRIATNDG